MHNQLSKFFSTFLLLGVLISSIGDEIFLAVMVLQLESLTSSGLIIASFLISQLLPAIFLSPVSGFLVDRFDSARVLVVTQTVQAALLLGLSFVQEPIVLILGSFALGSLFALSQPCIDALLPVLPEKTGFSLHRINAVYKFISQAAFMIGPVTGGLLLMTFGASWALRLDALTFAFSILAVLLVGLSRPSQDTTLKLSYFSGASEGFKHMMQSPTLRVIISSYAVSAVCISLVGVSFVFIVRDVLGAGPGAYGLLYALWGIGMLIGTAISSLPKEPKKARLESQTILGLSGIGVSLFLTGNFPFLITIAFSELIGGVANGLHSVARRTLLQLETDQEVHGRVFAAFGALNATCIVLGYAIGGFYASDYPRTVYITAGLMTIVVSLIGYVDVLRLRRRLS